MIASVVGLAPLRAPPPVLAIRTLGWVGVFV
jgi:hypothetical protein